MMSGKRSAMIRTKWQQPDRLVATGLRAAWIGTKGLRFVLLFFVVLFFVVFFFVVLFFVLLFLAGPFTGFFLFAVLENGPQLVPAQSAVVVLIGIRPPLGLLVGI